MIYGERKSQSILTEVSHNFEFEAQNFDTDNVFVINNPDPGSVRIAKIDDGFKFLLRQPHLLVKTENLKVRKFKLNTSCTDSTILSSLSGRGNFFTIADIATILLKQPNGEDGILEKSGFGQGIPHMFYVTDESGRIWVIRVRWRTLNKAWHIDTWSTDNPQSWSSKRYFYTKN